jgi:hypothetical protein
VSSARAAAGSESPKKRSDEQPGDKDGNADDDEERARTPLAPAEGYER